MLHLLDAVLADCCYSSMVASARCGCSCVFHLVLNQQRVAIISCGQYCVALVLLPHLCCYRARLLISLPALRQLTRPACIVLLRRLGRRVPNEVRNGTMDHDSDRDPTSVDASVETIRLSQSAVTQQNTCQ